MLREDRQRDADQRAQRRDADGDECAVQQPAAEVVVEENVGEIGGGEAAGLVRGGNAEEADFEHAQDGREEEHREEDRDEDEEDVAGPASHVGDSRLRLSVRSNFEKTTDAKPQAARRFYFRAASRSATYSLRNSSVHFRNSANLSAGRSFTASSALARRSASC